ncbi:MAG: helix-turn-helix domain containing protein [Spirochaetes bacterium]|nr:helix-turn-helix domain containing protein [Spirochaetota bacterium]
MSDEPLPKRMGRPIRKSGEPATNDRILDAAILLFSERGYEGTSMKQIAQAVGLTESAIYRHFKGKEDLLAEIIALTERAATQPISETGKDAGGSSVFRRLFEAPVEAFSADPRALRMCRIFFTECPRNERMRTYLKYAMEEMADVEVRGILEERIKDGAVLPCDTRTIAHLINVVRYQWCYQVAILDRDEAYDVAKNKRDLEPVVEYFERLYSRG